jgi:hypothetical protein
MTLRIQTGYARSLWRATLSVDYLDSRSLFRKILQPFRLFRSISSQLNAEPSSIDPGDNSLGNTERRLQIRQFKEKAQLHPLLDTFVPLNPETVSAEIGDSPIADDDGIAIRPGVSDFKLSSDTGLSSSISAGVC